MVGSQAEGGVDVGHLSSIPLWVILYRTIGIDCLPRMDRQSRREARKNCTHLMPPAKIETKRWHTGFATEHLACCLDEDKPGDSCEE